MHTRNEAIFRLTVTLDRAASFPVEGLMGCVFIDYQLPLWTENPGFALYTAFTVEAAATSGGALSANPLATQCFSASGVECNSGFTEAQYHFTATS